MAQSPPRRYDSTLPLPSWSLNPAPDFPFIELTHSQDFRGLEPLSFDESPLRLVTTFGALFKP